MKLARTCGDCGPDTLARVGDRCACGCECVDVTDEVCGGVILRGVRTIATGECERHRVGRRAE